MNTIQPPTTVVIPAGGVCPRCGAPLGGFGPEGLCGACMFDSALAEDPPAAVEPVISTPQCFGDYEIIEEIARGGMGVVLKARQLSLNRMVALKVIRSGDLAGPVELRRFREEAQTAASLQHPNIVAIHEVGERDGLPFFSMDYVAGQNLAQLVRDNPLPAIRAAGYLRKIAKAVQHAHARGVLHRDLKPSNVLIDANDLPRVTDFGLAKQLTGNASLTLTGQIIGSPSFMPPEQAAGGRDGVGPASDVYSLGALLYHLLTARPPFVAESVPATLRLLAESEPASPRLLVPSVPADLETICLKCLQKDPAHRYATAQELDDDLGRFLRDESIHARPAVPLEKLWRWCRRNRALSATATAVLVLLLTVAIGSPIAALRINRERLRAEKLAVSEMQHRAHVENLMAQGRQRLYATRINLAQQIYEAGDVARVEELLSSLRPQPGEEDLRGFEWHYLQNLCAGEVFVLGGHTGLVRTVACSPDGRTIASAGDDAVIRLWDAATGKERAQLRGHTNWISAVAFAPDGKSLASVSADRTARLWDMETPGASRVMFKDDRELSAVAFSPDGRFLTVGTAVLANGKGVPRVRYGPKPLKPVHRIMLWDIQNMKMARVPITKSSGIYALTYSPDGQTLVSGGRAIDIVMWNMTTNRGRVSVTNSMSTFGLSFAPDGSRFACAAWEPGDDHSKLRILDAVTGEDLPIQLDQPGAVTCLAYQPQGRFLATAGPDQLLCIWDAHSGKQLVKHSGHTNVIWSLAWSPDGERLATAGWDGTVRVWDAARRAGEVSMPTSANFSLAFSPDGRTIASGGSDVLVWDATTGRFIAKVWELATGDINVAYAPDGKLLAACGSDGGIHLFETQNWSHLGVLASLSNRVPNLVFSPDGKTLAAAVRDKTVRLFDVDSRTERLRLGDNPNYIQSLAFTPDGKRLITAGNPVKCWDARTGETLFSLPEWAVRVVVSPDGTKLATVGPNHMVSLFELATMKEIFRLKGHKDEIFGLTFSPDNRTLATASWDGTVKLWHVASGEPMMTFKSRFGMVWSVVFSPDGRTLAFSCGVQTGGKPRGEITLLRAAPDAKQRPNTGP